MDFSIQTEYGANCPGVTNQRTWQSPSGLLPLKLFCLNYVCGTLIPPWHNPPRQVTPALLCLYVRFHDGEPHGARVKNATISLKRNADHPAVAIGHTAGITVTLLPPLATQVVRSRRAAELQSAPLVLTALKTILRSVPLTGQRHQTFVSPCKRCSCVRCPKVSSPHPLPLPYMSMGLTPQRASGVEFG